LLLLVPCRNLNESEGYSRRFTGNRQGKQGGDSREARQGRAHLARQPIAPPGAPEHPATTPR